MLQSEEQIAILESEVQWKASSTLLFAAVRLDTGLLQGRAVVFDSMFQ